MRLPSMLNILLFFLAIIALALAFVLYDSPRHNNLALLSWIISWAFPLIILHIMEKKPGLLRIIKNKADLLPILHAKEVFSRPEITVVIFILLVGAFSRMWSIETFPTQLHNDEMNTGLLSRQFLSSVDNRPGPFQIGWQSQPNLGFYIVSRFMIIFGRDLFGLRISSALYGVFSLVLIYLNCRLLFGRRAALIGLLLSSLFPLHLHFSRTGFQQMQALTFSLAALYAFLYGLKEQKFFSYAVSGVLLGIALQTYTISLIVPLMMGHAALYLFLRQPRVWSYVLSMCLVSGLFCILAMAPVIHLYLNDPDSFSKRARHTVWVLAKGNEEHIRSAIGTFEAFEVIKYQIKETAKVLIAGNDKSVEFGYKSGLIDFFILPLSVIGFLFALFRIRSLSNQILVIWIGLTFILGGVITVNTPYLPRLVGLSVFLTVLPGLAINEIMKIKSRTWRNISLGLSFLLIGCSVVSGCLSYFVKYPKDALYSQRDGIARLLSKEKDSPLLVSFLDEVENVRHEAYQFNVPELVYHDGSGVPLEWPSIENTVRDFSRPILLVFSNKKWSNSLKASLEAHGADCSENQPGIRANFHYCWLR